MSKSPCHSAQPKGQRKQKEHPPRPVFSITHMREIPHQVQGSHHSTAASVFFWSILFGLQLKLYLVRGNCKGKPIQEGPHKYLSDSSLLIQALNKPNKPGLNLL
ncbi:unnamed protein product [Rangifer tarandus platyrhynchus]|uniref:Uncharacterized protein n=1 Tax=Rangifer tarandus platyrhynchus TaxID=3082113 RepID=A0AC59Z1A4_RANTA